jgi:hypothetical protein
MGQCDLWDLVSWTPQVVGPLAPSGTGQELIPASLHWVRVCRDWLSVWA